ncbi:hypothetical protein AAFN86_24300 [Roseomonas sp. CAU 1739]|uniref:hypothetical protein n=1 Tax=Roseomonas sp. CAU 1739 TaxID=3140364 RepID=UPI00325C296D
MNEPPFPPGAGRKLVFLHLPKTGGTTLHHHFREAFAPEEICPERFSNLHKIPAETLAGYRYFSGHFNYEQVRLIPGPCFVVTVLRDPAERILSTYYFWKRHRPEVVEQHRLTGPATARATDLLGFLKSTEPAVRDAVENTMARYLAGGVNITAEGLYVFPNGGGLSPRVTDLELVHRASGNLAACDLFGFTSHLPEVYAKVAWDFGMKRVQELVKLNTRESESPALEPVVLEEMTPAVLAELDRLTVLDRMVYRLARAHWRVMRGR